MTASEHLRRLGETTALDAITRADEMNHRGRDLLDALPLLIDVVEAAESLSAAPFGSLNPREFYALRESIAALREHLEQS